jgi:hypothetical protein
MTYGSKLSFIKAVVICLMDQTIHRVKYTIKTCAFKKKVNNLKKYK